MTDVDTGSPSQHYLEVSQFPSSIVTLTRQLAIFPDDNTMWSVLYEDYQGVLEGRERYRSAFQQPVATLIPGKITLIDDLQARNLYTVTDLLRLQQADYNSILDRNRLTRALQKYIADLALTPHARLLGALFHRSLDPVPADREKEQTAAVEPFLSMLTEVSRTVLTEKYGLTSGIHKSLAETRRSLQSDHSQLMRDYGRAMLSLGSLAKTYQLDRYLSLPTKSIARDRFDFVFLGEIPLTDGPSQNTFQLPVDTAAKLAKIFSGGFTFNTLLTNDLSGAGLTEAESDEIVSRIANVFAFANERRISEGTEIGIDTPVNGGYN